MKLARYLWTGGLLLFASLAWGHIVERSDVRSSMDPLPVLLKPVTVQLRYTMAPEVLIENRSPHTLVIYDDHHVPFIRIGPRGVDANLTSPAWYESRQPVGTPTLPKQVHEGADPKWARVSNNPSFGWFDRRVAIGEVKVPDAIADARKLAAFSHWKIPVAFDGQQTQLSGRFVYIPPATGYFESRLMESSWSPQKGVSVSLTPGRQPAVFISNGSGKPLVVFGRDGEPFLRIGPDHVEANLHSSSWMETHQSDGLAGNTTGLKITPQWHRVAGGSRYAWVDLRAGYQNLLPPAEVEAAHRRVVVGEWSIPLRVGDQSTVIKGETVWVPFAHPAAVETNHARPSAQTAATS